MKVVVFIKKLIAAAIGINTFNSSPSIDIMNANYILALNPVSIDSNVSGYIIIIMLVAIVILIGYTLISNGKNNKRASFNLRKPMCRFH